MQKLKFLILVSFVSSGLLFGQSSSMSTKGLSDDMTTNPSQNKSWRMGQSSYSAKPKNAWELGVHGGHFFIDGDVDRRIPGGYGVGLHMRKAVHYVFSLRGDFMFSQARGVDPQMWTHRTKGGGLVEDVFSAYANQDGWFPAHKTTYGYIAMQGVLNIGNILFHKDRNKWNWYVALGAGLSSHRTMLNLTGSDNLPYSGLSSILAGSNFDTKSGRKEIVRAIDARYDNTYETESWKKAGIFRLGDETNIHVVFTGSTGVSRRISKRLNLALEHQVIVSDNDMLDGIRFRTALDQTNNNDLSHYTNLRLGINLGNFNKVTEPLYWLNPLDAHMNDLAELKQRPVFDLTDTDGDGVIDMLDQEINSPAGATVDTRGVTLDSDGDGIPDYIDKEPFSKSGYEVDKDGVAKVPCCITLDDINKAIDARAGSLKGNDCNNSYLPMIHFDLDKATLKPEFYGHLHHVAQVMKMCPDLCITVHGHTDVRSGNAYNNALSYARAENVANYLVSNYGIDRSRIKIMYGGKDMPIVKEKVGEKGHYINRRVEIRVCAPGDQEMSKPEGSFPNFKGVKSRSASKMIGDKNAGF